MGAAAPARPGLVGACNEEVRRTAEPRSAATAGMAVRDYSEQPVKAANYGSDNEMIRRSDNGNACERWYAGIWVEAPVDPLGRPNSVVMAAGGMKNDE